MNDEVVAATKLQIWQQLMSAFEREQYAKYAAIQNGAEGGEPAPINPLAVADQANKIFEKLCLPRE